MRFFKTKNTLYRVFERRYPELHCKDNRVIWWKKGDDDEPYYTANLGDHGEYISFGDTPKEAILNCIQLREEDVGYDANCDRLNISKRVKRKLPIRRTRTFFKRNFR